MRAIWNRIKDGEHAGGFAVDLLGHATAYHFADDTQLAYELIRVVLPAQRADILNRLEEALAMQKAGRKESQAAEEQLKQVCNRWSKLLGVYAHGEATA